MPIPTIHIHNASLTLGTQSLFTQLNLELPAGKWIALLGPSGIGKSSLLRMVAGLISPVEGSITADNQIVVSQQIAYMAQTDLLLPWLSVIDNVTLNEKLSHYTQAEKLANRKNAHELLDKVGLSHAIHLYPQQLSGGMRQRVALVRTLMEDKPIILMDEPFSALDAITRYSLQNLACELLSHKTVFFITHDPSEALRLANYIYLMQDQPTQIKLVTELHTQTPRSLSDVELMRLQQTLLQTLAEGVSL